MAGAAVHVVIVTDGGFGVPETHREDYVFRRQQESIAAAQLMACGRPEFWSQRDREVAYGEKLVQQVLQAIQKHWADLIYAPSIIEMHPDHRALGMAAVEAVRRAGGPIRLAMYEVGMPLRPNLLLDISDVVERKRQAMECFASQNDRQRYDLHIAALNRYRTYTLPPEVVAAEAYVLVSAEELANDPLKLYQSEYARQAELGLALDPSDLPLVSVIIRSVGRPELTDALNSVALQTFSNIEVVLVNAKGSGHVEVGHWCGRFPLRMVGSGEKMTRSRAANTGLDSATGDYLIFLDDDNWFEPDHIQNLVMAIRQHPKFSAVYSGVKCVDEMKRPVQQVFDSAFDSTQLLAQSFMPIHAVLFCRKILDLGCRADESFDVNADWDFSIQMSQHGDFLRVAGHSAVCRATEQTGAGASQNNEIAGRGDGPIYKKWFNRLSDRQINGLTQLILSKSARESEKASLLHDVPDIQGHVVEIANLKNTVNNLHENLSSKAESYSTEKRLQMECLSRTSADLEIARAEIRNMTKTVSWRITGPLRFVRRKLVAAFRQFKS
jgi:LmbE family N-acetylglucosaminyl deacetylase